MARGVNKVLLIGNLGADPEVRYSPSGSAVTNVRLATTESWKDKQTGERQEKTEWHRVVFFGKLAEIAGQYLNKGSKVYVEGRLQTNKWQAQDGSDRYTTQVISSDMQMLDGRGGGQGGQSDSGGGQQQDAGLPPQGGSGGAASGPPDDFDDDIPFAGVHGIEGG